MNNEYKIRKLPAYRTGREVGSWNSNSPVISSEARMRNPLPIATDFSYRLPRHRDARNDKVLSAIQADGFIAPEESGTTSCSSARWRRVGGAFLIAPDSSGAINWFPPLTGFQTLSGVKTPTISFQDSASTANEQGSGAYTLNCQLVTFLSPPWGVWGSGGRGRKAASAGSELGLATAGFLTISFTKAMREIAGFFQKLFPCAAEKSATCGMDFSPLLLRIENKSINLNTNCL